MIRQHRYKCANCHKIQCQMYIIACRAHFCHLLGLGEVGHSPRGTSGSVETLDWGPMWSGSQSTCHPQFPLHPYWLPDAPTPLMAPNAPDTPTPQCPLMPLHICWPLNPYTPYQPPMHLTPPVSPLTPLHPC